MGKYKISIIGAGNVGALAAKRILEKDIADVVLVDIVEGLAEGKSIDLNQSQVLRGSDFFVEGTNDFSKISGSEVVVVSAGQPRLPGMSREDLIRKNGGIVRAISVPLKEYAAESIIIAVTNPLDVMSWLLLDLLKCDPGKIMGMGGVLDTSRYIYYISRKLKVSVSSVSGIVIGSHGDTMLPVISRTTVNGKQLSDIADEKTIEELVKSTKNGGAEIVNHLKTGSACFAPGDSIAVMVESIIKDFKKTFSASVLANGEYGLKDVFIGLPVVLGKNGVERIYEIKLLDSEFKGLEASAEQIRKSFYKLSNESRV